MVGIALGVAGAQWAGLGAIGSTTVAGVLGSVVGSYLDAAYVMPALFGQDAASPNYGGLNISAADEGSPIWRVHGQSIRVPGLLLFVNEPRAQSRQNRTGKRGEQTTHTWYTDAVFGFGKSVAGFDRFIERIYVNNTLVFDERDGVSVEVYVEPTDVVGVGRVAGVYANYDNYLGFFGNAFGLAALETTPGVERTVAYVSHEFVQGRPIRVLFDQDHGFSPGRRFTTHWIPTGATPTGIWGAKRWWHMFADDTDPRKAWMGYTNDINVNYSPPPGTTWDVEISNSRAADGLITNLGVFDPGGKDIEIVNPTRGTRKWPIYDTRELPNGRQSLRLYPALPGEDRRIVGRHIRGTSINPDAIVWHLLAPAGTKLTLSQDPTPYNLSILESGAANTEFGYVRSRALGGNGTSDQPILDLLTEWVGETQAPGFREMSVVAFEDWNLSSTGNALGNVEGIVQCRDVTIGEVVTNVCKAHGMDTTRLDVSGLTGTVRGYRYNGVVDGRQALQPLVLAFDIRSIETDDGVTLLHSADCPTLTVPEDDWIGGGGTPRLSFGERNTQIQLRSVQVKYLDADRDQVPGTVTEVRSSGTGGETRVISLDNLVLTKAEARTIARRILRQTHAQVYEVQGTLPMPYSDLTENTIVTTTVNGRTWRFRTTRVEVGANFDVRVSGVQEEVYT